LHRTKPLAEDHHTEADRDERIDEVAEARLDDVAVVDAPDVNAPVDGDEDPGSTEAQQRATVEAAKPTEFVPGRQQDRDDDEAEEDPARKDLEWIRRLEERPEEREKAPQQVRAEPVQQPTGGGCPALVRPRGITPRRPDWRRQ
jgi:hypothetical protein